MNDTDMPLGWEVGSKHLVTMPEFRRPAHIEVVGWFINHTHDSDVRRFIHDRQAFAVRVENLRELKQCAYKPPRDRYGYRLDSYEHKLVTLRPELVRSLTPEQRAERHKLLSKGVRYREMRKLMLKTHFGNRGSSVYAWRG